MPSDSRTRPLSVHTVAVIAFDRISPFHLSVPCLVFGEDRRELGVPQFDLRICAAEPGPLRTSAGFGIDAPATLADLEQTQLVIVPSWRDTDEHPPPALLDALRAAHARGACVVGLCLGAYVLAEAGLLNNRAATTHWHWADDFSRRFPQVRLNADVLYIADGDVVTSAGVAAGIDCCLHLLRGICGAEIANRVARRIVAPPYREGGQAQYIEHPLPATHGDDRVAATLTWAAARLERAMSVDDLAAHAVMSRRTFTRHVHRSTGTSVGRWLLHQRLALAQRLLERSDHSIDTIAANAGFGSAISLRQHFAKAVGTTPSEYRRTFRGRRMKFNGVRVN